MIIQRIKYIYLLLMVSFMTVSAQKKQFTLEDLNFGGSRYNEMSPEKRHYIWNGEKLLRKDIDQILEVMPNGTERLLFDMDDLQKAIGDEEYLAGINFLNIQFPYSNQPFALIITPTERWLYDYKKSKRIFKQKCAGSLEWNAESRIDVFSNNDNLWIRMPDGTEKQLTYDGSREITYGRSVHRNEFGIEKGVFFSPDGQSLAFYRMDQTMVTDYPQVNTFGRIATYEPDKYPMSGETSHDVMIGIYDVKRDTTVYLNLGNVTNRYFTNISWSPDGKSLYLIELNREQNIASLDQYNTIDGNKLRTINEEKDEKYVEPLHPISFIPWDDSKFIHWSQQDGFWHLYMYDVASGQCIKQLTKGNYVVLDILGYDEGTNSVIIRANKENLLQRNLYAVNISTGELKLLDNGVGVHEGIVSLGNKTRILDRWTAPDIPRAWEIITLEDGKRKDLGTSKNPWTDYAIPLYKQGTIIASDSKTQLYYRMVLPPDFNENEKYPTVIYVYGGPHAHMLEASWHWNSRSWETYMAQKGYIVFVLDNRGSEHRGKDFEQITFLQLGQEEMKDQMKGVEFLKSLPYVDSTRLGIHGWSFGGYMTISLMTNYPGVFKAGVAGGPVIDWSKYEVMYTERYMKTPQANPEGYKKTNLETKAKELRDRLLIVIGMNDPVVVPQHSMQFLNACNENGTYPDFYVYPGEEHNMQGHMSVHLHEKITRYFEDFLK